MSWPTGHLSPILGSTTDLQSNFSQVPSLDCAFNYPLTEWGCRCQSALVYGRVGTGPGP